jgi:hypothetical protein
MATVVAEDELYQACRIIFGSHLKVTPDFLQYLQLSGIKKAYRNKALELHPDRGFCQNLSVQQVMSNQFIDVHQAYEKLVAFLEARDKGTEIDFGTSWSSVQRNSDWKRNDSDKKGPCVKGFYQNKANDTKQKNKNNGRNKTSVETPVLDPKSLYRGPLPNCQLLFGRYLYYSGLINLHTIGPALVWQRAQRPCFGEIGRRMGWMNEQDTLKVLNHRKDRQLFGELAMRLGILTREQLQIILLHQKKFHKRIGQYFVLKNYWDDVMLEEYVNAHRNHNSRVQSTFV